MSLMIIVDLQFMQQNLKVKQNRHKHIRLIIVEDLNIMAYV
jgi:hypothetical protein